MSNLKNVPRTINGDTVVGLTNTQKIKDLGWMDMASLSSWYQEDPDKNHLGLVETFSAMADFRMPTYKNFFKSGSVLTVNGMNGSFRYSLPVTKPTGTFTSADTSDYNDAHGIDGTVFPIDLDKPFTTGDVLTYDAFYGEQVVVSEDHTVEQRGDVWRHWVKLVSNNSYDYFPADQLKAGIQYFKVGHVLGEYSTQFSNIETPDTTMGTIECEFTLGNHRGVESFYTMYADMKRTSGATLSTRRFLDHFKSQQEQLGTDKMGRPLDMYYVAKLNKAGKIDKRTVRLGASLEYLVLLELMKLESHQLMFQKAGTIRDINGTKRLNEGLFHQIRRGRVIKYAKPNGITRGHIKEAVSYLFRNRRDMMPHQRRVKFKCGYMAYINMLDLFREEVLTQLEGLAPFLGTDRILPKSPVTGKDLTSLSLEPVMFTSVNIPEIGIVTIEHDPCLDYQPLTDRHSAGFYGEGYAWTSYSMVIWDAMDDQYSNAFQNLPAGTTLAGVNKGSKSNVYYVKPEGNSFFWGYEQGRYSPNTGREIYSANKRMGREIFAHSSSAVWVKDISRFITIELKR